MLPFVTDVGRGLMDFLINEAALKRSEIMVWTACVGLEFDSLIRIIDPLECCQVKIKYETR